MSSKITSLVALTLLSLPTYASAKTVTYSATECKESFSYGQTESRLDYHYFSGSILNHSNSSGNLYCPLHIEKGKDIEKIEIYYSMGEIYGTSPSGCHLTLFDINGKGVASGKTEPPKVKSNSKLSMGPFMISHLEEPVKGNISCQLPVPIKGSNGYKQPVLFKGYTVTYM